MGGNREGNGEGKVLILLNHKYAYLQMNPTKYRSEYDVKHIH